MKNIPVPFCDECGEPWLPKFRLADGTRNPIFDHPEDSKRCGKCKTTRWNAAGVDRRRKQAQESVPEVSGEDVMQTIDRPALVSAGRCKHMLYNCPQCHPKEAV